MASQINSSNNRTKIAIQLKNKIKPNLQNYKFEPTIFLLTLTLKYIHLSSLDFQLTKIILCTYFFYIDRMHYIILSFLLNKISW